MSSSVSPAPRGPAGEGAGGGAAAGARAAGSAADDGADDNGADDNGADDDAAGRGAGDDDAGAAAGAAARARPAGISRACSPKSRPQARHAAMPCATTAPQSGHMPARRIVSASGVGLKRATLDASHTAHVDSNRARRRGPCRVARAIEGDRGDVAVHGETTLTHRPPALRSALPRRKAPVGSSGETSHGAARERPRSR